MMEILQRITKIETKIEALTNLDRVAADAYKIANEALQNGKSAHHRLDAVQAAQDIAEDAQRKANEALTQLAARADDLKWFKRTFYGATLGAIAAAIITTILAAIKLGGG
jgi:hypothetical protein